MIAGSLETNKALLEPYLLERYKEELLGGEAHVGNADPRSPLLRLLESLRASQTFRLGFGFASGILIGTGLAILLSRRSRNRV
jgi:hypothetical protein